MVDIIVACIGVYFKKKKKHRKGWVIQNIPLLGVAKYNKAGIELVSTSYL